jgi:hypothetical protein
MRSVIAAMRDVASAATATPPMRDSAAAAHAFGPGETASSLRARDSVQIVF